MQLNNDLITQFAKITKFDDGNKGGTTVRGTVRTSGDRNYIQLDGADDGSKTPVETTVEISDGDRVVASVKDHRVIVTGNQSNPSVGVKTADGLKSSITQTASEIRTEVANEVNGLKSNITQTANAIRSEVADEISGVNSTITQTAKDIRSEVADEMNGVKSNITQTAKEINSRIDNLDSVDTEEFTEFKQTVEGFYFTDENGTVYIDGGSVYAKNLKLTGAITWEDLSSSAKNTIDSVADVAESKANLAYNLATDAYAKAGEAYSLAENIDITLPSYIKETYIDSTTIQSPNIIGGRMYAVGSDPNYSNTFSVMDENGFYIYHDSAHSTSDEDTARLIPKMSLRTNTNGKWVRFILGSGEGTSYEWYNRFYISKETNRVDIQYVTSYDGGSLGFTFLKGSDEVTVHGTLGGSTGLFPIGYVYMSFDTTSPASLFGGTWERIQGYFLYPTGSDSKVDTSTGNVMTSTTSGAPYINVAAWRRVA